MTTIDIPTEAEHLSMRVTLLGLANMVGILEYYAADGKTKFWGPVPFSSANMQVFEAGHHLYLLGTAGEGASQQRGRYAYVVVDINNYDVRDSVVQVLVEFFSWKGQTTTRIGNHHNLYPDGTIKGKSDARVSEIFQLA